MTTSSAERSLTDASAGSPRGGRRRRPTSRQRTVTGRWSRVSYVFVSGYALLALAFGVLPTLYAVFIAFLDGDGRFAGIANFTRVVGDFRFWPAVLHVGAFLLVWLVALLVLVTLLALLVHGIGRRWLSSSIRFVYYIPGALAGASSVVLWLFVLNPSVSPVAAVLRAFGFETFVQTVSPANLPVVFAIIAFWTGAGGWIVVMYGALNSIPDEVLEAARMDGAGVVRTALHIQLPMLRKWISYMAVMSLATGAQLFVEPRVLSQASHAVVPSDWSLNQLAYLYAFKQQDLNGSSAIAVILLVVSLGLSTFFVVRGGLFERD
ncbi:carbohydrate ABC transporter permease [Promicromonospora panici]|uniref:carbohydrate ABC transporter permease n=1 Tax=Promicromonospora panici TaxID=2219658 RepID=UPI0013ED2D73|nr:sugar ABC transporter permease [Promicromonospora panici]